MSDAPRIRQRRELDIKRVAEVVTPGRWSWFWQCEEDDFVNCTFGDTGECQNVRHTD